MQQDRVVPDETLRAEIMAALVVDSRTAHAELRVGVLHGIVHLAGAADSLAERAAAEALAAQAPGVRGVVNRIAAPGAPSPTRKIDLDLKTR
jgi:osmotically-inducible protein OsmY